MAGGVDQVPPTYPPSWLHSLTAVFTLRSTRWMLPVLVLAIAVIVPFRVSNSFTLGILTDSLIYVVLALSYDLSVGRVGALSLAHAAFFGTGAYTAAIVVQRYGLPLTMQ